MLRTSEPRSGHYGIDPKNKQTRPNEPLRCSEERVWLKRHSVVLQKQNAAAFKVAAGAATTWEKYPAPGLAGEALKALASAEQLAAVAA